MKVVNAIILTLCGALHSLGAIDKTQVPAADTQSVDQKKAGRVDLYGDPLPPGAVARLGSVRFRNPKKMFKAITFSPDGKTLAVLDKQGHITLWSVSSGKTIREFTPPLLTGKRQSLFENHAFLAFSPDGKSLLAGLSKQGKDLPLMLWDVASAKVRCQMQGAEAGFITAAVSADFKTVAAVGRDKCISVWDVATGKKRRTWPAQKEKVLTLAVSANGKVLASAGDDHLVHLWDVQSGKHLRKLTGCESPIQAVSFSPDGKIVVAADWNRRYIIWNPNTGKQLHQWHDKLPWSQRTLSKRIYSLVFSPHGKRLAAATRFGEVYVWQIPTGKRLHRLQGDMLLFHWCAFSPKGHLLAVSGMNRIYIWDLGTGRSLYPAVDFSTWDATFSPDSKTVTTACSEIVQRWDAKSGKLLQVFSKMNYPVLSKDGQLAIDVDRTRRNVLYVKDLAGGGRAETITLKLPYVLPREISPTKKYLAFVTVHSKKQFTLFLLNLRQRKELRELGAYTSAPEHVAFSPKDNLFVAIDPLDVDGPNDARGYVSHYDVWDTKTGKRLYQYRLPVRCNRLSLSPDGRYLAATGRQRGAIATAIVELKTGNTVRMLPTQNAFAEMAFSPDGKTLATAWIKDRSTGDMQIKLWDVKTGRMFKGLSGRIFCGSIGGLAFSPDGKRLVSFGVVGLGLIWDVE